MLGKLDEMRAQREEILFIHTHFFTTYKVCDPTSMVGVIQSDLFLSAYNVNNMNTQILICILNEDEICLVRRAVMDEFAIKKDYNNFP